MFIIFRFPVPGKIVNIISAFSNIYPYWILSLHNGVHSNHLFPQSVRLSVFEYFGYQAFSEALHEIGEQLSKKVAQPEIWKNLNLEVKWLWLLRIWYFRHFVGNCLLEIVNFLVLVLILLMRCPICKKFDPGLISRLNGD